MQEEPPPAMFSLPFTHIVVDAVTVVLVLVFVFVLVLLGVAFDPLTRALCVGRVHVSHVAVWRRDGVRFRRKEETRSGTRHVGPSLFKRERC